MFVLQGPTEELESELQRSVETHDEFLDAVIISYVHILDVVATESQGVQITPASQPTHTAVN